MLDFNHILATPGYDIQQFYGEANNPTLRSWQTWKKPRGVNWVYMIGVGGGGGGGTGRVSAVTSGAGGGGGSGGQSILLIPSQFVPDTLYVQAGFGGAGATTVASAGAAGIPTYVAIEPVTTLTGNMTILYVNGGSGGVFASGASGGAGGAGGVIATTAGMPLAYRGVTNFIVGQAGTAGGTASGGAGTNLTPPITGLMVTGGAGGGGTNGSAGAAGGNILTISNMLGTDFFPVPLSGGTAASGATPATAGASGFISRNFLFNFGGTGGGGASGTVGGNAGAGGGGAPGCGGGGGGGLGSSNPTVARGGNGGGGFVIIISW